MEDLLALLFIVISIGGFINRRISKDVREKARTPKREEKPYRPERPQANAYKGKQIQPKPQVRTLGRTAGSGMADTYGEGFEFEERHQAGSLAYAEQDTGTEGRSGGRSTGPDEAGYLQDSEIGDAAMDRGSREIGDLLAFSAEDMFRSIVMTEILGNPRSIKRNIR